MYEMTCDISQIQRLERKQNLSGIRSLKTAR